MKKTLIILVSLVCMFLGTACTLHAEECCGVQVGLVGDVPAPGDYDGDGYADPATWREHDDFGFPMLYIRPSMSNACPDTWEGPHAEWGGCSKQVGLLGDVPAPGDYDGDGKADPSTWRENDASGFPRVYIRPSSNHCPDGSWEGPYDVWGGCSKQIGLMGDIPAPGDYDGDGKADPSIWRENDASGFPRVYIRPSSNHCPDGSWEGPYDVWGGCSKQIGLIGDVPAPGDYDGDRKNDVAIWRESDRSIYMSPSSNSCPAGWETFGNLCKKQTELPGNLPACADYDKDRKADPAMWNEYDGFGFPMLYIHPSSDDCPEGWGETCNTYPPPADLLTREGNILKRNGQPIRLKGYGAYGLVAEEGFDYESFFNRISAKGINFVRIWVNYHWANSLTPFTKKPDGKYDLNVPNAKFYDRLERFVYAAGNKGIVVQVTLFDAVGLNDPPNNNRWTYFPYNSANGGFISDPSEFTTNNKVWEVNKRLISEVVGRLGNFGNVIYEVMNEPHSHWIDMDFAFHKKVVKELRRVLAGYSGSKIISVNIEAPISQEDIELAFNNDVDVIAYHLNLVENCNIGDYNALRNDKPIIVSNDGDITQKSSIQGGLSDENRRNTTKCYIKRAFEGDTLGHRHFEFLDKGFYANSWTPNDGKQPNYNPDMKNVEGYVDELLNVITTTDPSAVADRCDCHTDLAFGLSVDNNEICPGKNASVPLILNNIYSTEIEGIDVKINFDKNVLVAIEATLEGGILQDKNYGIVYQINDGEIAASIFAQGTTSCTDSGIVAYFNFYAVGDEGDAPSFTFDKSKLNEADADITIGSFSMEYPSVSHRISGKTAYYSNGSPVSDVLIELEGDGYYSATSDADGNYDFSDIPGGSYNSAPYKNNQFGGLSGMDASRIAKYATGFDITFNCYQMLAADVNRDGQITGLDASRVARYTAGKISYLNYDDIHWIFVPADSTSCDDWPPIAYESEKVYSSFDSDMPDQDFIAVRLGDVTGNWSEESVKTRRSRSVCQIEAASGSTLTIPVALNQGTAIEGIDIKVAFDETVLEFKGASLDGGVLEYEGYVLVTGEKDGGATLTIPANDETFTGTGEVAFLTFDVIGQPGDGSVVSLETFECNEVQASGGFKLGGKTCNSLSLQIGDGARDEASR